MKRNQLIITSFAILSSIMLLFSCEKDETPEEEPDPCEGVTCLNGGHCANGECICPEGFTGADCSQQVTPQKIKISSIIVTDFPATDGGAGWDLASGPDIFILIMKGNEMLWESPTYYQNADPSSEYEFTPSTTIDLTDPTSQYSIALYDYDDLSSNDFMGGYYFTPYEDNNGFPEILEINDGSGLTFTLNISYNW